MPRILIYKLFLCVCFGVALLANASAQHIVDRHDSDKHAADRYTVTVLPGLSDFGSFGIALNDWGEVVGQSRIPGDNPLVVHAFLWDGRKIRDISAQTWQIAVPYDINDRGEVVGRYNLFDGTSGSFFWTDGHIRDLEISNGFPMAINDRGSVVGSENPSGSSQAFLWRDDVIWRQGVLKILPVPSGSPSSTADAINNRGEVTGTFQPSNTNITTDVVVWRNEQFHDLGVAGIPAAINDRGQILINQNVNQAAVWQNGVLHVLSKLPDTSFMQAYWINDLGQVVGADYACGVNACSQRPVLWETDSMNPIDLSAYIPTDLQPSFQTATMSINNRGQILISSGGKFEGTTLLLTPRW